MEITKDIREGEALLVLVGRFEATWSEGVADVLGECVRAGAHVVRLDLDGIVFLSSAGIRVLLAGHRDLSRLGGSLAVVRASDAVTTVLHTSGLTALLQLQPVAAAMPGGEPPERRFEHAGVRVEQWTLDRGATMRVRAIGDAAAALRGRASGATPASPLSSAALPSARLAFPRSAFGLGTAAFGRDAADCAGRHGEFLAVGGAAICHADIDAALPDWVLAEGDLVPEAEMLWGLAGEGAFATELRFEAAESATGSLTIGDAAALALDAADAASGGAPLAIAMVAETAQLVGAALRKPPSGDGDLFDFPAVRERLLFTAEPAWTSAVALVVGVVARRAPDAIAPLVRPLVPDASLLGHLHAAAFPYRPLRKGRLDLAATLAHLFEDESVRALLHLVNDWREPSGAGQSAFTRGIVWCSPLEAA